MQFDEFLGIELAYRPGKPRESGITMVNDIGWPAAFTEDACQSYGHLIDIIKFTSKLLTYDVEAIKQKVGSCLKRDIVAQPGGMVVEIARALGKEREALKKLKALGFNLIEMSASEKADRDMDEERRFADLCRSLDLDIIGEVGKKFPTGDGTRRGEREINVEETIRQFQGLIEMGAKYCYWEGHVLRRIVGETGDEILARWDTIGPQVLAVVKEVGLEHIIFEVSPHIPYTHRRQQQFWWVRTFGPTVNLGNVRLDEVPVLEDVRRGVSPIFGFGELGDHPWLQSVERGKGKASKNWWEETTRGERAAAS
jgi:phosphosulfolactate synthase